METLRRLSGAKFANGTGPLSEDFGACVSSNLSQSERHSEDRRNNILQLRIHGNAFGLSNAVWRTSPSGLDFFYVYLALSYRLSRRDRTLPAFETAVRAFRSIRDARKPKQMRIRGKRSAILRVHCERKRDKTACRNGQSDTRIPETRDTKAA